jgi:hypothetical protein
MQQSEWERDPKCLTATVQFEVNTNHKYTKLCQNSFTTPFAAKTLTDTSIPC